MIRPYFADRTAYGALFTNTAYWQAYVAVICARHGLECHTIRSGLPGTNAVFLVDQQYAVKLYSDLFGGSHSFPAERECYALIAAALTIAAPVLIASGELFDSASGWPWPYLVTSLLPGMSLGESDALSDSNQIELATWLGTFLRQIHGLPLAQNLHLRANWGHFLAFLHHQRAQVVEQHTRWGVLPPHLITALEDYLPPVAQLVDQTHPPRLLHCDLNADHVLGDFVGGQWLPSGVIDFGDAKVGDPVYELVALHLGLFRGNKTLLNAALSAYADSCILIDLPRRAMAYTLLHEFNVLEGMHEQIQTIATLEDLAEHIWNITIPINGLASKRPQE
jgi:hygromycin-B 7''-O-kinase